MNLPVHFAETLAFSYWPDSWFRDSKLNSQNTVSSIYSVKLHICNLLERRPNLFVISFSRYGNNRSWNIEFKTSYFEDKNCYTFYSILTFRIPFFLPESKDFLIVQFRQCKNNQSAKTITKIHRNNIQI